MYNTCIVYRLDLANQLLKRGFRMTNISVNKNKSQYLVYHFEESEEIRQAIKEITSSPRWNQR